MFTVAADQYIERPPDEVARAVLEHYFEYQPSWDPTIESLDAGAADTVRPGASAHIERNIRGQLLPGECVVTAFEPGSSIEVELRGARLKEVRRVSCHPLATGGTRVHVEVSSELRGIASIVARLSRRMLTRGLEHSLHGLRVAIEGAPSNG